MFLVDMTQTLASNLCLNDLDSTLFTGDAAVLHPLVLAAVALIVLHRTKDASAEESITFRLKRPVVDGFRLLHLSERPRTDLLGAGDGDLDGRVVKGALRLLKKTVEVAQGVTLRSVVPVTRLRHCSGSRKNQTQGQAL